MRKTIFKLAIIGFISVFTFQFVAFSDQDVLNTLEDKLQNCNTYDDYGKYISELKDKLAKDPGRKDADILYYAIARARVEELAYLAEQNDIESARIYMRVNDEYFNEALTYLDKASQVTKSKELMLDINFLRFLIFKNRFQSQRAEALFNDIVNKITTFSEDHALNKIQLDRISQKFDKKGLRDRALKLRVLYASRAGQDVATEIAEEIKKKADSAFEKGDTKRADTLYKYYIDIGRSAFGENLMAKKTLEIADGYFDKRRYTEALRYYDGFMKKYPNSESVDYCTYKIGLCLYANKNYPEAIVELESFLDTHPNSKYFDAGFESLSRAYYETLTREKGVEKLQALIEKYKEKEVCDYAVLLKGILYYLGEDYGNALKNFRKIQREYPRSKYFYTTEVLIKDIEEIRKGDEPSFGSESEDTYKIWQPYAPIKANITPEAKDKKSTVSLKNTFRTIDDAFSYSSKAFADQSIDWGNEVEVLSTEGDVDVAPGGKETKIEVNRGMALGRGDRIKTGPSSSCDISFDSKAKNVVGIQENSDVVLLLDRSRKLEVIEAHLFARLAAIPEGSSFEVKTPLAVCGARGTGFGVKGYKENTEASAYDESIYIRNIKGKEEKIEEGFRRNIDESGEISELAEVPAKDITKYQSWPVYIKVQPGQEINLTLTDVKDLDKFAEYLYDKSDVSRLPKKVGDETQEDLLSVIWTSPDGKFLDGKQSLERTWKAPETPGRYTISVDINDLGLVRPPDEGTRKDSAMQILTVIVIVEKE